MFPLDGTACRQVAACPLLPNGVTRPFSVRLLEMFYVQRLAAKQKRQAHPTYMEFGCRS